MMSLKDSGIDIEVNFNRLLSSHVPLSLQENRKPGDFQH